MITRISLVWKHAHLDREEFALRWLGDHADAARRLVGLREYVVDVAVDPPLGAPDGVAILRFDSRVACDAAFADAELSRELTETRDEFAARVQVVFVEEHVVYRSPELS